MFEWIPKIYIINLDKHKDRWAKCQEELKKFDINNYERFSGVIHNEGKTVKDRERGCSLSHFGIIENAKANKYPFVLVFEDDIEIDSRIKTVEDSIKKFVETNKWDLFYLGGNNLHIPSKITDSIGKVLRTYTTHAYFIHSSVHDKILSYQELDMQIDVVYADKIQTAGNSYITMPRMITQSSGHSYIQGIERNYNIVLKDA